MNKKIKINLEEIIEIAQNEGISLVKIKNMMQETYDMQNRKIEKLSFDKPKEIVTYCRNQKYNPLIETVNFLLLNEKNELLENISFEGGESSVCFDERLLLKSILISDCKNVVMIHNHPSGLVTPSDDDLKTSDIIGKNLKPFGVRLLDSIIYSEDASYSFVENELPLGTKEHYHSYVLEKLEIRKKTDFLIWDHLNKQEIDDFSVKHLGSKNGYMVCFGNEKSISFSADEFFDEQEKIVEKIRLDMLEEEETLNDEMIL